MKETDCGGECFKRVEGSRDDDCGGVVCVRSKRFIGRELHKWREELRNDRSTHGQATTIDIGDNALYFA